MRIAVIHANASDDVGLFAQSLCVTEREQGHSVLFCYAMGDAPESLPQYRMHSKLGTNRHLLYTRLTDHNGYGSRTATRKLIAQLKDFSPDLIHLYTLHGYYLNIEMLFRYLKRSGVPVIWSMHDCWAFTGHCTSPDLADHFQPIKSGRTRSHTQEGSCTRWMGGCGSCPLRASYPGSWFIDRSAKNHTEKRALFCGIPKMLITVSSERLQKLVSQSFLKKYPIYLLPDGISTEKYRHCDSQDYLRDILRYYGLKNEVEKHFIFSSSKVWDEHSGIDDLLDLAEKLGNEYCVMVAGLDHYQREAMPPDTAFALRPVGNVKDECALLTLADVYISTARDDYSGFSVMKALSCGTPVLCWDTADFPSLITPQTGRTVKHGDIDQLTDTIKEMCTSPLDSVACREKALSCSIQERLKPYMDLYEKVWHLLPGRSAAEKEEPATELSPLKQKMQGLLTAVHREIFRRRREKANSLLKKR